MLQFKIAGKAKSLAKYACSIYNKNMKYYVKNLQDTFALATKLADKLTGREIILLNGDLGAGKTTFTKALAAALGVFDTVTSPTFAFMKEYLGKYTLYHYDLYRAESEDELFEVGLADALEEDGICVIEWNKFTEFPKDKIVIDIEIEKSGECERIFDIEGIEL